MRAARLNMLIVDVGIPIFGAAARPSRLDAFPSDHSELAMGSPGFAHESCEAGHVAGSGSAKRWEHFTRATAKSARRGAVGDLGLKPQSRPPG
jgi:hypothetical protein